MFTFALNVKIFICKISIAYRPSTVMFNFMNGYSLNIRRPGCIKTYWYYSVIVYYDFYVALHDQGRST